VALKAYSSGTQALRTKGPDAVARFSNMPSNSTPTLRWHTLTWASWQALLLSPASLWTTAQRQFREVIWRETLSVSRPRPRQHLLFGVQFSPKAMGVSNLKTPFRAPQANAFCERLIGSIRRECLDFLIPLNGRHLRGILKGWATHYNKGRPHSGLGPGIPDHQKAFRCRKL